MKLSFRYFALVVMGAMICGCAEEVEDLQPSVGGTVTMKTTISLSEQASTRALTEAGVKNFEAGDKIAVIYKNTNDETVKVESTALTTDDIDATDAHKATFSVSLTNPKASTPVRYIYPASRAADDVSATTPNNDATIKYDVLATQVGTFDKIASDLDLATFDGNMTAQGNLPKTASLVNPLTIGKFTIKNTTDADMTSTITKLTIGDGANTYTINPSTLSTIYVAMKPIVSTQTITVDATDGTNNYTKSVTGNALSASSIYTITVKALKKIDLSQITAAYTAQNGEVLTGTLDVANYPVKISIADGATVTLNGLTINGTHADDDAHKHAGITCEGDATIILADGSTNTVRGFHNEYPGIIVAVGKTLTIKGGSQGTGSLNASSNKEGAGIGAGGYYNTDIHCGNIEILSGNITAIGGDNGAGIGGGRKCTCGNVTISGGTIVATGGYYGAGIGSGDVGTCGNITISEGTITATGGYDGAGIGGGDHGSCGNITISGGFITASGCERGAGIGGGNKGSCGNITIISGENITATGGNYGAGIGSGDEGTCSNITISGGFITASGGNYGAGIGGGRGSNSDSNVGKCGNIIITTGVTKVEATKGSNVQYSIGKGRWADCGTVTIGCTLNSDGTSNGGTTGYISDSPYTYQPPAAP